MVSQVQRQPEAEGVGLEAYRAIFEHTTDGVLFTIPDGRVLAANPAACRLLRMTEKEICERGRSAIADVDDDRWLTALATREREGQVRAEVPLRRGDGTVFVADLTSSIFATEGGGVHACVVFRDVSERVGLLERQSRLVDELRALALVDELTGLRNRRGFFAVAEQQLALADRESVAVALVFLDLDGLKQINDEHGHAAGDRAIVAAADAIRHATRSADLAARLGGDELVIILHAADERVVEHVLQRIRRELERTDEPRLSVTAGVASRAPGTAVSVDDLLAEADRRMYEAKPRRRQVVARG